ncbi:N-acetylmuramoyl-L-alanine amidase [Sedimentitalea sp. JM2-8]|uniref:N-acetylmuramoyl-L-alanine amidase n=1 Tax=Sedimentitalea xiamensis TaxID=3050037 RepID=A0ABT7FCY3_9RHOB|nr:N-acetylmuramoyl-L-alanine amidase [Sedimentitalea xiamensis]MDK3072973.1 N-acetylmuramoyl-L-alanine amidase [Sedimentitalea xiamensis]
MIRPLILFAAIWLEIGMAQAGDLGGHARVDAERSRITDAWFKSAQIDLYLSQGVPFRLFTLDAPPRLVLDLQEADWTGLRPERFLDSERVTQVRFGDYLLGWSRLVLELDGPMSVSRADMTLGDGTGGAHLTVRLQPETPEAFAAGAGAPLDPRWDLPPPAEIPAVPPRGPNAPLVVVLDPGHGGLDPGAETDTVNEKTLMLTFARELRDLLERSGGFHVVLTRDTDRFVSLEQRVSIAHQMGADVFLSLHADALAEGMAHGATVHVLARDASDSASARLAERHDRADLLSGIDLSDADDEVTGVLLDLARQETRPRTEALAKELVRSMAEAGGPMNNRPLRRAAFSVLKAADIPSVLIEIGFLSSPRDLRNLRDPVWRAGMALGLRNGLLAWRDADIALRPLIRQ